MFYHSNNCIVLKDAPTSKDIKGVLILTSQSKTEIITKRGDRHENTLSIVPGEGQKNYILAFDSYEQTKLWHDVLTACCKQQ